jgi:hypothetical protein
MKPPRGVETPAGIWPGCGYRQLEVTGGEQLAVTDSFLRGFYHSPELAPIEESCPAERELFADLLAAPRLEVPPSRIEALADPDARDNYHLALAFRDLLLEQQTLEAAYARMIAGESSVPPVFLPRLIQPILRHLLDGETDPRRWRAAEVFFRPQAVQADGEQVLLADLLSLREQGGPLALRRLQSLIREAQGLQDSEPAPDLDLVDAIEPREYVKRSERFDTVLDITAGSAGSLALTEVMARFIRHFHGVDVSIRPVTAFSGKWRWHIGLDAEATTLLDDLYRDGELDPDEQWRLIGLYELRFDRPEDAAAPLRDHPVYLAAAMTEDEKLYFKAQNLLVNLPLATLQ